MAIKSMSYPESTSQSQTQVLTLPNLKKINTVTVNTGTVSYSLTGNTLTFTLTNGAVSRTVQTGGSYIPADSKTVKTAETGPVDEAGYHSMPNSQFYSSGGYSGTLTKQVGALTPSTFIIWYEGTVTRPAQDTRTYAYYYQYNVTVDYIDNSLPSITLAQPTDNLALTEGSTYKLEGSVSDADAGQPLSVKYSIGGGPTQSITLGTSDGTTAKTFSKTLTYSQGRFWDGTADVSGLLPAEVSSIQVWVNDGSDDSAKVTRNFTAVQEDGKLYVPVNVVSKAHLVSQMARPVRLNNGWLVGAVYDFTGKTIYLYKSTNNGKAWAQLCYVSNGSSDLTYFSIASKDSVVCIAFSTGTADINLIAIDAIYATNTNLWGLNASWVLYKGAIDSGQTAFNGIDLIVNSHGSELWWAASTKNSTLPNSFNIRTGFLVFLSNGTLDPSPGSASQLTYYDASGTNITSPCVAYVLENPAIISVWSSAPNNYGIYINFYLGFAWDPSNDGRGVMIYDGGGYPQASPQAITTPNDKLHVVWHGTDSDNTVSPYIRYSNSTDAITWPAAPRKLVKGQNASITSDKNGKLSITYEDGGYIKRIESTDEFVTYQGPFVVGAGTKPATLYDQLFQTDFSVPPTLYQAAGAVKYYGVLNPNKKPVVTLTTPDNQTLTENATLSVAGSALDQDVDNAVTIKYRINGGTIRNIASGVSDGSTLLSFARDLRYSGKRMWDGAVDVAGVDLAENTDHTLAVWAEDDKGGKSAEVMRKFRVVWNRPPTISGQNSDLGTLTERPTVTYSAADPEGNSFTFTEYLNGQQVRSFAGTGGQQNTFELTHDAWIKLDLDVQHQLKIVATDSAGISAERVYTFTRTETHLEFMLDYNNPDVAAFFTVDGMPERILFTLERYLPPDSEIESVLVTNNYLDATPTWEDARNAVIGGRGYIFTNKTKTAADWAICVWVTLAKGSATQRVHVYGYGGAFD